MDEYMGYSGKTGGTTHAYLDRLMVMAAGNSGGTTGLLGTPADSFNGLSVGALDSVNPRANALFDANRAPAGTTFSRAGSAVDPLSWMCPPASQGCGFSKRTNALPGRTRRIDILPASGKLKRTEFYFIPSAERDRDVP